MQLKTNQLPVGRMPSNREDKASSEKPQEEEYNYQYYEEYKRLYHTAYYLSLQLRQLIQSREDIWDRLQRLEKKTEEFKDDIRGELPEKKKRFRRTAEQIERRFVCTVQRCMKCYGSQGSLQQHIKLKHPELYEPKLHHGSKSRENPDEDFSESERSE